VNHSKHVWSEDPSLDKENSAFDWPEFLRTGDLKYCPAVEGGKLTVFEIRPLSRKQFSKVFNMPHGSLEQCNEAVAFGLRAVRDFQVDQQPVEIKHTKVDGEERCTESSLNAIFEPLLFVELGLRIMELSRLHPQNGSR
jgi:hypothetical protein